jgi:hypothetical protein
VTNSTISGNSSPDFFGGGIFNEFQGTLTVMNSTITGNSARLGGGGIASSGGGTAIVTNSTITGNFTTDSNFGGGGILTSGSMTVTNSTISGNNAPDFGGGIMNAGGGLTVNNTIIAGNTQFGSITSPLANCGGTISGDYNLYGTETGCSIGANSITVDPSTVFTTVLSSTLANNGGATQTLALLPGSPAIDAGSDALIPLGIDTDQRGTIYARVNNSSVDIGAYETPEVNDAPTFTAGGAVSVLEDSGAYSATWATNISAGPANESGQTLDFLVSNNNNALFSVQPAISPSGVLTFTPASNVNGLANVQVQLRDNGGTANGGDDTSDSVQFLITVNAVNDTPAFTSGGDVSVNEDSGAYSATWATGISAGPADEIGQSLFFNVSSSNPSLFSVQPVIAADGTLTFTPQANANGVATLTVTLSIIAGNTGGAFAIDNAGLLTVAASLDFETTPVYTLTVQATDDSSVPRSGTGTITVNLIDADEVAPTVTINQGAAQADPTGLLPIVFDVVFSEAVSVFESADVSLVGSTADVSAATVLVSGSGSTYTVSVSGVTGTGAVVASISAGVVTDAANNPNAASTSTDNSVTYDPSVPTAAITLADPNPTTAATVRFTVTFNGDVNGVDTDPATQTDFQIITSGSLSGVSITGIAGSGAVYTVTVNTGSGTGIITLSLTDDDSITNTLGVLLGGTGAGNGNVSSLPYTVRPPQVAAPPVFPTPQPVPLCALFGGGTNSIVRADVPGGLNANVFCRVLVENTVYVRDAAEVGDATLIGAGVLQAVDVFGFTAGGVQVTAFNQPIRVCLQGSGRIFFRDATTAPRVTVPLAATSAGGYTCATIPNAGTVVLVR